MTISKLFRRGNRIKTSAGFAAAVIGLVAGFEGYSAIAYRDGGGVPTVCFGETRGVKMGDRYTRAQCEKMLVNGLSEFETGMAKCIKQPDKIPDKSYAAFLSFTYNVGVPTFCQSSVARYINAGNLRAACNFLPRYHYDNGKSVRGLINRRAEERKLCLEGLR